MAFRLFRDLSNLNFPTSGGILNVPGKGYLIGWGTALPTTTVWAKGAIFIRYDAAADTNLYINEAAAGYGTSPSWVAQTT